jgi:hypothetical protein
MQPENLVWSDFLIVHQPITGFDIRTSRLRGRNANDGLLTQSIDHLRSESVKPCIAKIAATKFV